MTIDVARWIEIHLAKFEFSTQQGVFSSMCAIRRSSCLKCAICDEEGTEARMGHRAICRLSTRRHYGIRLSLIYYTLNFSLIQPDFVTRCNAIDNMSLQFLFSNAKGYYTFCSGTARSHAKMGLLGQTVPRRLFLYFTFFFCLHLPSFFVQENKSFVAFSNPNDARRGRPVYSHLHPMRVLIPLQVCTKVAIFLEQGHRLENLSWRLWLLQNLIVDNDVAKSRLKFRRISMCMGHKFDNEKVRPVSRSSYPSYSQTFQQELHPTKKKPFQRHDQARGPPKRSATARLTNTSAAPSSVCSSLSA